MNEKPTGVETLDGSNVIHIHTLGSWFDQNSLAVVDDDGNKYRLKADELDKIINDLKFKLVPKRVHTYLEIIDNIGWHTHLHVQKPETSQP